MYTKFYWKNIISKFDEKYNKKSEVNEFYREKMRSIGKELEAKLEVVEKLKEGEESIKGKPDILCIAISNLIAYSRTQEQYIKDDKDDIENCKQKNQSKPQLMEIDGLILGLTTEKELFICLIEAKSGNEGATRAVRSKIRDHENDIFRGYDISNLLSLVRGLNYNSTAYLIITDEKIPTSSDP